MRQARYGPACTEQVLGALPVVAGFCRRLDIAGIIDRAAPVREIAYAAHGQVIEALIANRLSSPSPMIHVAAWARQFAVEHALGLVLRVTQLEAGGDTHCEPGILGILASA